MDQTGCARTAPDVKTFAQRMWMHERWASRAWSSQNHIVDFVVASLTTKGVNLTRLFDSSRTGKQKLVGADMIYSNIIAVRSAQSCEGRSPRWIFWTAPSSLFAAYKYSLCRLSKKRVNNLPIPLCGIPPARRLKCLGMESSNVTQNVNVAIFTVDRDSGDAVGFGRMNYQEERGHVSKNVQLDVGHLRRSASARRA